MLPLICVPCVPIEPWHRAHSPALAWIEEMRGHGEGGRGTSNFAAATYPKRIGLAAA